MKRLLIATIILLLWAGPAMAKIDSEDVGLFIFRTIDLKQTLDIVDSEYYELNQNYIHRHSKPSDEPNYTYCEKNPLLGNHPSKERVYWYFGSLYLLDWYFNKKSGESHKWYTFNKWWQRIQIGAEAYCVNNNYELGLGWGF